MLPGANGGVEWSPCALYPGRSCLYYVNLHQPMNYTVKHESWDDYRTRYSKAPNMWLGGAFVAIQGEKQWGNVIAVNIDREDRLEGQDRPADDRRRADDGGRPHLRRRGQRPLQGL